MKKIHKLPPFYTEIHSKQIPTQKPIPSPATAQNKKRALTSERTLYQLKRFLNRI